jgi:hypothetical protein
MTVGCGVWQHTAPKKQVGFYGENNAGVETKGAGSRAVVERQSRIVFEDV